MLLSLDHKIPGLNPTGGRIKLMTVMLHCTEPFIVTPLLFQYDLSNDKKDVKHQRIIIIFSHK